MGWLCTLDWERQQRARLIIVVSNGNISHDLAWACLPSSSAGRRTFCQRSVQSLHQSVSPDTPRLADRRAPCQIVRGVRSCGQRRNFLLVNFEPRARSRESLCSFFKDADARPTKRCLRDIGKLWDPPGARMLSHSPEEVVASEARDLRRPTQRYAAWTRLGSFDQSPFPLRACTSRFTELLEFDPCYHKQAEP